MKRPNISKRLSFTKEYRGPSSDTQDGCTHTWLFPLGRDSDQVLEVMLGTDLTYQTEYLSVENDTPETVAIMLEI